MPKKRWSSSDDRKYKAILKSCRVARGRKKGVTKACKRIAAATVERDRGLQSIGMRGLGCACAPSSPNPVLGGLRGTPAEHRAAALDRIRRSDDARARGDFSTAFLQAAVASDEADWSGDPNVQRTAFRDFALASDPSTAPRWRPLPDTDLAVPLEGRRRRRRRK